MASTAFITLRSWWKEADRDSPGPSISGTGAITHKLSIRGGVVQHVGPTLVVPTRMWQEESWTQR
jgi:hypothetical protein